MQNVSPDCKCHVKMHPKGPGETPRRQGVTGSRVPPHTLEARMAFHLARGVNVYIGGTGRHPKCTQEHPECNHESISSCTYRNIQNITKLCKYNVKTNTKCPPGLRIPNKNSYKMSHSYTKTTLKGRKMSYGYTTAA